MPVDRESSSAFRSSREDDDTMARLIAALKSLNGNDCRKNQPFFSIWEKEPLKGAVDEDVHQFFENFEYQASLVEEIDDNVRLVELKKCLRDRPLSIFQCATEDVKSNFQLAKEFLLANLTLPHQQAVFRHDFHTRKKEENESG